MKKILLLFCILPFLVSSAEIRVVSLSPAMTELICHLGGKKMLVGRSEVCDFPPEITDIPVAGKFADPQIEKILRLKPDLVVSNDLINPGIAKVWERSGSATLLMQVRTMQDYRQCVKTLGEKLHAEAAATAEIRRIDSMTPQPPLNKKVLWVLWDSPLMTAGQGSFIHELLLLAGAENITGDVRQEYFKCSYDFLLKNQPDIIVWTASARTLEQLQEHRIWKKLQAVQQGKVLFLVPGDPIQRPGPRIFERLQFLRKSLEKL
jgi:iron complex transport system substrate-binding protein